MPKDSVELWEGSERAPRGLGTWESAGESLLGDISKT